MTQDEIIRMAIECQLLTTANRDGVYAQALERFAALVAAHEREACAKVCDEGASAYVNSDYTKGLVHGARLCAAAIRARGGHAS